MLRKWSAGLSYLLREVKEAQFIVAGVLYLLEVLPWQDNLGMIWIHWVFHLVWNSFLCILNVSCQAVYISRRIRTLTDFLLSDTHHEAGLGIR